MATVNATSAGRQFRLACEDGQEEHLQALGLDRNQLASTLDAETARARRLEATNREIAERLDLAIASIQSVLDTNE